VSESPRKELDTLNQRYQETMEIPEKDRKPAEEQIVQRAMDWGRRNPHDLPYLLGLAQGLPKPDTLPHPFENPLFYEALGRLKNPAIVPMLAAAIKSCDRKQVSCFYVKQMFRALIMIDDELARSAVGSILKAPKKSRLTFDFVQALMEVPDSSYLPIVVKIAESGFTYQLDAVLALMAKKPSLPFQKLLEHKSEHVRGVAIEALKLLSKEHLDSSILQSLKRIVRDREEDIVLRSQAADLLKSMGMEVPAQFRDHPKTNVTGDIRRFVTGVLHPETRGDDWAMQEIVELKYQEDKARVTLRYSLEILFADVKIWRGCFWDVFHMGFNLSKIAFSRDSYRVVGITRATRFQSEPVSENYLLEHLDETLIRIVNKHVKAQGAEYDKMISTINEAIRDGRSLLIMGKPTWETDEEKLRRQGGC